MKLPGKIQRRLIELLALGALAAGAAWLLVPPYRGKLDEYPAATRICDRHGRLLRMVLSPNDEWCEPIPLAQAGDWAAKALIAGEDKRFYRHGGVDPLAVVRAAWDNLRAGRVVSGASTITMLVAKLTEPRPRNVWTKLVESRHALDLEQRLTKQELLEQYLNRAPFGANLNGIEAAARRYFAKSAADLTLAEAALLVGLPQAPSRLRPDRFPEAAEKRRNYVLEQMRLNNFISERQFRQAAAQPVLISRQPAAFLAPHFCDLVARRCPAQPAPFFARKPFSLSEEGSSVASMVLWKDTTLFLASQGSAKTSCGLPQDASLKTSLDCELQALAEKVLRARLEDLHVHDIRGGAVVILEVKTGAVRALVGSPDYASREDSGQVNGALARRSPGSALKPFVFALALDEGLCSPRTVVADVPMDFAGYRPQNYNRDYCGPVSVQDALVKSLNIPALFYTERLGLENVVGRLRAVGLATLDRPAGHYGLSVAVGSCEVTLLDLANAYACLARRGVFREATVLEQDGAGEESRLFSAEAAYLIAEILSGGERGSDSGAPAADVRLPRIAWKTGTSTGNRDAWCLAYNPEYVVGVWIGNPAGQGSPALVGVSAAAPVALGIFRHLYPDGQAPWFERPRRLKVRQVCAVSGLPPNAFCPVTVADDYLPGVTVANECAVHRAGLDGGPVREVWPPEVAAFLASRGLEKAPARAAAGTERPPAAAGERVRIVAPGRRETFRLLEDAPNFKQEIVLRAVSDRPEAGLFWFVDRRLYCQAAVSADVLWPLARGTHLIGCYDRQGRGDTVTVVVE
jgi:penicillin-binding protein 1C